MNQRTCESKKIDSKSSVKSASLAKAAAAPFFSRQAPHLQIQRQFGNAALQQMYESEQLQAKLKIGAPNDKYEGEADSIADGVMTMPDPQVQRKPG
ncbi:MAG: hypothetical protein OEV42_07765 [Deltaproteobacteria bacterium]|nr:hypothetical protein [Deltaproteobacteria bacterium]